IEGVFDFFALPAVVDDRVASIGILSHLPEKMGSAAGGVLFLMSGAPAGAHHAAFFAATLAHPDASQGGVREAAVILRELEMRFRLPWCVTGTETEIVIQFIRLN